MEPGRSQDILEEPVPVGKSGSGSSLDEKEKFKTLFSWFVSQLIKGKLRNKYKKHDFF